MVKKVVTYHYNTFPLFLRYHRMKMIFLNT